MRKLLSTSCVAVLALSLSAAPAAAQDWYASVSAGAAFLDDSDNSGAFNTDFTTGAGTTVPAGAVLPAGTPVSWTTEFDSGYAASAAIGRSFGVFRGELEIAYQKNDIDTHSGVTAGGIALDGEDAGVLITGSPNLGVTVGALVDDGQGDVETTFLMANGYYDFDLGGAVRPYVGAGVGFGMAKVNYSPSDVQIIDDDETVFAYQAIVGATLDLSSDFALFAQYRYRATTDVETQASLFDATLDIENRASLIEAGFRYRF